MRARGSQHQTGMDQENWSSQKRTVHFSSRRIMDDITQEMSLGYSQGARDRRDPHQQSHAALTRETSKAQKNLAKPIHVTVIQELGHVLFFLKVDDARSAHMIEVTPLFVHDGESVMATATTSNDAMAKQLSPQH